MASLLNRRCSSKRNGASPLTGLRGQALVEFLLVAIVLIAASYGASRLIAAAWKLKFNIITTMRCGITGTGP